MERSDDASRDDAEVDQMVDEIVAESASPTAEALFAAHGRGGVRVHWSPTPEQLPLEGHRILLKYWLGARDAAAIPPVSAIDPFPLRPVLGNLMILEPLDGGADFRFRLYGTAIAEAARFDWSGSTLSEMQRILKGPGPKFFRATYRALLRRPEPLYTESPAVVVFTARAWGRLILPFGAPGMIARILVGNYVVSDDVLSDDEERRLEALRAEMQAAREKTREKD